jgi:DNA invertase Pin-like site-specific DNA recombinase
LSLKDGIDLSTPSGRMIANVLASIAQWETEVRGERVKAGQDAAKAAGKKWGGSKPGRKKVSKLQEHIIAEMYEQNKPISQIADAVGLSRPTIYDVLRATEATPC